MSAKFSKFWSLRAQRSGAVYERFRDMSEKYGSLVRIAPKLVLTTDPEVMRKAYAVRSPFTRSTWYRTFRFDPTRDNIASLRDNEVHRVLKAKMAPGYSGKENEDLEARIDGNITALVELISSKYISSPTTHRPMDVADKISYFTLDVIADIAYGAPFGNLATDTDVSGYVAMMEVQTPRISIALVYPWLMSIPASPLFRFLLPSTKDAFGFGRLMGIAHTVVGERFGPDAKPRKDMLGSFVKNGLTQAECESEVLLQIMAGGDTTATAIRMTLFHLISTPAVLSKLLEEIREADLPKDEIIKDVHARKLPYLQAVIKEGLRIYPPITGHMSKVVPEGGEHVSGHFLPAGTELGVSVWGMQHNKAYWGEDVGIFRPERFLEVDDARARDMTAVVDLIFSYGQWYCLGRQVAQIELNKVLVELLRNFTFSICYPVKPFESKGYGLFLQKNLWMRIEKRETKL
ncbi:hypothetical protein BP5796_06214 [Coleophoma crateriformis]|uniref:Uncharacterized protein n=1 Tax=Coleophoma crateriformis TaxID=565419 RepID=A0A3D8RWA4_9HELO|nr:hypothetical protein BP5796_06214 [Coleophoma crateriformis]